MGTVPKEIPGDQTSRAPSQDGHPVLDPKKPLSIARKFVMWHHTSDGVVTLRCQGRVFHTYAAERGVYVAQDEEAIRAALYFFLDKAVQADGSAFPSPKQRSVSDVLDALRAVCLAPTPPPCWVEDDLGGDPLDFVACRNGLLHVPTRILLPPTPKFFTVNAVDFDFDEAARPHHWLTFLDDLWGNDCESIGTLQEIFGLLLTLRTLYQKIFLMVGPLRSGKGTTGRVLKRLVGNDNACAPTLASLAQHFGLQNLIGKTVALISDARIGGRTDTNVLAERLLSISGEDPQSIPRKYLGDWNGKLTTRFLILTNELPAIEDHSGAFASRFIVLALTKSFLGREDHGLEARLMSELPGILNWALDGLDRLTKRGWLVQPKSALELLQQLEDLGSPTKAFVNEFCDIVPGHLELQTRVFTAWQTWCQRTGRGHEGTIHMLGKNLKAAVPGLKVTHHRIHGLPARHWAGLRLRDGMWSMIQKKA